LSIEKLHAFEMSHFLKHHRFVLPTPITHSAPGSAVEGTHQYHFLLIMV